MILTVTPNPSLDRTVELPALVPGAVLRASAWRVDPGGKGVNVSRVLAAFGRPTVAVMPGGRGELSALLEQVGVTPVGTPVAGTTRINTALVEADGTTTKINEPGPALTTADADALVDAVATHAAGSDGVASRTPGVRGATPPTPASWVVTAGSLPPDAPDDLHARIVAAARRVGARAAVDTSGPALAAAVTAGPDLVKPNVAELAELVGHPLPRLADVLDAAADLRAAGVGAVLVSMGAAGALLVAAEGTWHAASPPVAVVRSTVGAGDSSLAGYLIARTSGRSPAESLVHAVACGAAAVGLPGTAVPGPADVEEALVTPASVPDATLDLTGEAA